MTQTEKASRLFRDYDCTQAVFTAFANELGISEEQTLKIGGCFGSGMSVGEICGCVTGALMALGLKYGRCAVDDMEAKARQKKLCMEFYERFQKENGSCICRELKERAEGDPEETLCPRLVVSATEIMRGIMDKNR